jgi:large repetitive protein
LTPLPIGDANGQWEGVGTGWYYSVLGGGYSRREQFQLNDDTPEIVGQERTPLEWDNTATSGQRGDAAVSTLFNGNFDVNSAWRKATDPIPSWVFENNPNLGQSRLKTWSNILPSGSPDRTTYSNSINTNYALELRSGDSLIHNNFVVPDWGFLRFDLHASNPQGGTIQVLIKGEDPNDIWQPLTVIVGQNSDGTVVTSNSVTLTEGDYDNSGNPLLHDPNQLAYALKGFETFQFDIPEYLRGKTASIKFAVTSSGNTNVYLDNVFFKSKHMMLGNPTLTNADDGADKQESRFNAATQPNNLLVERPQYALSYNNREKGPNWVSYELNRSWVGNELTGTKNWSPDYLISPLVGTQGDWYENTNAQIHKGHMVTRSHRNRNNKDQTATYFTSSMLPQHEGNNSDVFKSAWVNFEKDLRKLAVEQNKEIYIISGAIGSAGNNLDYFIDSPSLPSTHPFKQNQINYPEETWKVAVVLNPGETIADITTSTTVVSIITPNEKVPPNLTPDELVAWRNWRNWRVSIDDIEAETGLDLLSNIPKLIQDTLESLTDGDIAGISASLLADFTGGIESNSVKPIRTFDQFSIRHSNLIEEAALTRSIKFNGTFKASFDQNCVIHLDGEHVSSFNNISSQNSSIEVGMTEISADTLAPNQFSFTQIGIAQVSTSKINSQKLNPTEVSMTEVGARQVITQKSRPTQIDFSEIDTGEHICINEINIAKITLPSSIPFQQSTSSNQFSLSNHSLDPQLTSIYSTAQSIWHTNTPIDLNFNITNLPSGQLAEATINGYDNLGRPNTATITLDDDGNGVGWFIDTTPQDNSEFRAGVGGDYFTANPDSAAYGKYDLLTTILHEMGHTLGIINGYSEFDRRVKGNKFVTASGTEITLTPDGSHLDSTLYPYDLMNTTLKTGVRKLPSAMDWAMIDALNAGFEERASRLNY